jgi:hypothetical protein
MSEVLVMDCVRKDLNNEQAANQNANATDKLQAAAAQEVAKYAVSHFDELDQDHNGFLTIPDLQEIPDRRMRQALINNIESLQSLSNDEWGFENDGITKNDLQALADNAQKMPEQMKVAREMKETLERNFSQIVSPMAPDFITRQNLAEAIESEKFSEGDTATMKTALEHFHDLSHYTGSKFIEQKFLKNYDQEVKDNFEPVSQIYIDMNK